MGAVDSGHHRLPARRRQKVLEPVKHIPSVPGGFDPIAGLELIEVPEGEMLANQQEWDDRYAKATSQAKAKAN